MKFLIFLCGKPLGSMWKIWCDLRNAAKFFLKFLEFRQLYWMVYPLIIGWGGCYRVRERTGARSCVLLCRDGCTAKVARCWCRTSKAPVWTFCVRGARNKAWEPWNSQALVLVRWSCEAPWFSKTSLDFPRKLQIRRVIALTFTVIWTAEISKWP